MINEKILNSEMYDLLDIIQNKLNWEMSLDTFEIENESLAHELKHNDSLETMVKELVSSNVGLAFTMLAYRAQENPRRSKEELMQYAGRVGYAAHQMDIENVNEAKGDVVYDQMFEHYEIPKYFELISDFLCDKYMEKRMGISKFHHESFIYFSMILGWIMRSQLVKHNMPFQNEFGLLKTPVRKKQNKKEVPWVIKILFPRDMNE